MQIVILDSYTANPGDLSWQAFNDIGELTVYDRTQPEEIIERAKHAEIVLTNKVCLREQEIEQLPNLKYIGVLATGYNVVDIDAARQHGIVVTNVPAYSTESVAQMVFAHLLTVTNRTEHYARLNREGKWTACPDFCYWDTELTELAGKTFGIVGLGNIGNRVATIALALGMKVVAYTSKSADSLPLGITKLTMEELLTLGYEHYAYADFMEATGLDTGILFLDEINCVAKSLLRRCIERRAPTDRQSAAKVRECLYHPAYRLGYQGSKNTIDRRGYQQCNSLHRRKSNECSR